MASKSPSGEIKDEHIRVLAPLVTERQPSNARQPISSLPFDVINLILNPENLPDAIDLARLRVVNRAMRDAMTATGREMKEMNELDAVNLGCLSTLKHLHSRGHLERKEWLCMFAARSGQLEVLQWARANGCLWNGETCYWAATGGRLEILQWARANGCPWNAGTCYWAAMGGHLEVLQWARANGCPWNENTCWGAAQVGHLEVLRWARANGCPWDRRTRDKAAELGYVEKDD